MVNLSTRPQLRRTPMINLSVLPDSPEEQPPPPPPRLSPVFILLSKIYFWFSWMAGFLCIKNKRWMAGRDQQKQHVFPMSSSPNIVSNSDFSVGTLQHWHCLADAEGSVIVDKSPYPMSEDSERETYAVIIIQDKGHGLEQEIHVSPDITYKLVARVGVLGIHRYLDHTVEVEATLALETKGSSDPECMGVARVDATSHGWTNLKGSFKLNTKYHRVIPFKKIKYHRVFLRLSVPDPNVNLNLIVAHVDIRPS